MNVQELENHLKRESLGISPTWTPYDAAKTRLEEYKQACVCAGDVVRRYRIGELPRDNALKTLRMHADNMYWKYDDDEWRSSEGEKVANVYRLSMRAIELDYLSSDEFWDKVKEATAKDDGSGVL